MNEKDKLLNKIVDVEAEVEKLEDTRKYAYTRDRMSLDEEIHYLRQKLFRLRSELAELEVMSA